MKMNTKKLEPLRLVINTSTDPNVPFVELVRGNRKAPLAPIAIKNVRLDTRAFLLSINHGERDVSFKSKRHKKDLEKETKMFKVLACLFEFRYEMKNGKKVHAKNLDPDYVSLKNIAQASGSPTLGAAYRHVKRLNGCFEENGLSIYIEKKGENCRLVVRKN